MCRRLIISPLRASPLSRHCPSCPQVTPSDLYVIARFRVSTFVSVLTTEMDSCSVYSFTVGCLPAAFRVIPPYCCASWWFIVQPSQSVTESQSVPLSVALGSSLVVLPVVSLPLVSPRVCFFCLCVYTRACTCARIFIVRRAAVGSLGMRTPSLNSASGQTGVQWIARRFFSLTEPCGLEVFRMGACRHASSM